MFKHLGHDGQLNIKYGEIKRFPQNKKVTDAQIELFVNTIFNLEDADEMLEMSSIQEESI